MSKYHTTPDADPDNYAPIGDGLPTPRELYELRVRAGLSKHEAADAAGVAWTTVADAEDATHETRSGVKRHLLEAYREAI